MLDDLKAYAVLLRSLGSVWSGVALIHTCQFHRTSGDLLRLFGEHRNLLPIALVGRSHRQGQQMSKGIDGDVDLRPFAPLGPIVSCPGPRLGCGLQRAAVDIHRRRLALASAPFAQQRPHILYQQLKAARPNPALASACTPPTTVADRAVENATDHPFELHNESR